MSGQARLRVTAVEAAMAAFTQSPGRKASEPSAAFASGSFADTASQGIPRA